ncbi:MAG: hypothetical protein H6722_07620 [Sandaracinus sp.]|nr:hypothetical protein [Sandaracinus sp.]MCB9612306.1 hypothetical protein [Sandaracinus sp.]
METFAIARDPIWRAPLLLIGATEARSVATLEDDAVDLRFGIAHVRIPYRSIRAIRRRGWPWYLGFGIRIAGDKTLGLVGSSTGVVEIALDAPTVEGVLFMRHPRNVAVSLVLPEAFEEALQRRLGQL